MISRMRKIAYYNIKSQSHSYKTLTLIGFEYLETLDMKRFWKIKELLNMKNLYFIGKLLGKQQKI